MSEILYNFAANHSSIDDNQGDLSGITGIHDEINTLFTVLKSVYEGQGADALEAKRIQISQTLDDAVQHATTTEHLARDQQDAMSALDKANAAAF
jgi:hypothetical protein